MVPEPLFSTRARDLRPSPIRKILSVAGAPGMISFAGGLPAEPMLPRWGGRVAEASLQYGPSEGEPALRAAVSEHLRALGIDAPAERVLIVTGSQQGIDLVAKLFIDPGTPIAVESPTYLAALQAFRFYGARFTEVAWGAPDFTAPLAYVVPTFANPTGACATPSQRDGLAAHCLATGTVLFEDDPYRDLSYDPIDATPVCARMAGGSWVYQGSFSKTFAPGLRVGFLAASADVFDKLVMLKQSSDLHSSRLSQQLVLDAITAPGWRERIERLRGFYRERRDAFEAELQASFAELAEWRMPPGGLFFWLRLRHRIDTRLLLDAAVARGVAFMPGEEFYPDEPELGTLRLNFSHAEPAQARDGLATLAGLIRESGA